MAQQGLDRNGDGVRQGIWKMNPETSRVGFRVHTMWGLVEVDASFDRFSGTFGRAAPRRRRRARHRGARCLARAWA